MVLYFQTEVSEKFFWNSIPKLFKRFGSVQIVWFMFTIVILCHSLFSYEPTLDFECSNLLDNHQQHLFVLRTNDPESPHFSDRVDNLATSSELQPPKNGSRDCDP